MSYLVLQKLEELEMLMPHLKHIVLIVQAPAVIWVNTDTEQSERLCLKVTSRWPYRLNVFIYLHTFTHSSVKPASLGLCVSLLVPVQMFDLDCVFGMSLCVVTCVKCVGWDLFEAIGRQDCSCGSVCSQRWHFYINILMVVCRWARAFTRITIILLPWNKLN